MQSDNSDIYANSGKFGNLSRDGTIVFATHSFLAIQIPIRSSNKDQTIQHVCI